MSVTNIGKTRALYASGDLSSSQYCVVYQNAANTVAIAGDAQNTVNINLFILQNAPADGEICELLELGSGNSYAKVLDSSANVAAEMMIGTGGKLVARSGVGYPAIARLRKAVAAANTIVEVDTIKPGSEGTLSGVTATATELNVLDVSAQTETILVAGAVSVTKRVTKLSAASGAYAVTLAAPSATMLGQIKIIEMTVAGNAITMALTEVLGGSAATTASFDGVNETLTLIAGTNKWIVLDEHGVTLS